MKMKEVCTRTGLSERAIRLYCEQGLLTPAQTEVRGRVYLDFDEDDITALNQIAALRGIGFSLEEIKAAQQNPHVIGTLLADLRRRLTEEQGEQSRVLALLNSLDADHPPANVADLCAVIKPVEEPRPYANGVVLQKEEPSFREFCEQGGEPVGDIYTSFDRSIDRGRVVMVVFGVLYWLSAGLNLLINLANEAWFGGLLVIAVQALLYFFLFRGVAWIRVIVAIFSAFNALFCFVMMADCWPSVRQVFVSNHAGMTQQYTESTGSWTGVVLFAVIGLIYAAVAYFLSFNKWVSDYLYDRATQM